MSYPIDRQAAIDAFNVCVTIGRKNGKTVALEVVNDYANAVIKRIMALPPVQPELKWIPCSERLPEDYTDVLVWFEYFRYGSYNRTYQTYGIGTYSGQYGYDSWMINHETGWNNLRVIAWMPLPEPYKEDNNG